MRKKRKVVSVPQRNLMGYAYACATGKANDCPPAIQNVVKSFLKRGKKKGLESLRKRAKEKHAGLSPVRITENTVLRFYEFETFESNFFESDNASSAIQWLYSVAATSNLPQLYPYIHDYITDNDKQSLLEYIEEIKNILTEKGDPITQEQIDWVTESPKKRISEI